MILLDRRLFCNNLAFVDQFTFTDMCAVAYMDFTGGAVFAQRNSLGFVMRAALGAALLRMSSFGIWHNATI